MTDEKEQTIRESTSSPMRAVKVGKCTKELRKQTSIRKNRALLFGPISGSPLPSATEHAPKRLVDAAKEAILTVASIVAVSVLCILVTWGTNFCMSLGYYPKMMSIADQSESEFRISMVLTATFVLAVLNVVLNAAFVTVFRSMKFDENLLPAFRYCVKTIFVFSWKQYLISVTGVAVVNWLICHLPKDWPRSQLSIIAVLPLYHIFLHPATLVTLRLLKYQTILGKRERPVQDISMGEESRKKNSRLKRIAIVFLYTLPYYACILLGTMYTVAMSGIRIDTQQNLLLFVIGAVGIRLCIQELIKQVITKLGLNNISLMSCVIGVQIVMIDTQVRMWLDQFSSAQATVLGTSLLAVAETGVRLFKLYLVQPSIRFTSVAPTLVTTEHEEISLQSEVIANEKQRRKLLFHAAELYAEMLSEYIAIGCAASVVLFMWDHPKFALGFDQLSSSTGSRSAVAADSSVIRLTQYELILVQVGVEILVDIATSTIEAYNGVNFIRLSTQCYLFFFLYSIFGIMNIYIACLVYFV